MSRPSNWTPSAAGLAAHQVAAIEAIEAQLRRALAEVLQAKDAAGLQAEGRAGIHLARALQHVDGASAAIGDWS